MRIKSHQIDCFQGKPFFNGFSLNGSCYFLSGGNEPSRGLRLTLPGEKKRLDAETYCREYHNESMLLRMDENDAEVDLVRDELAKLIRFDENEMKTFHVGLRCENDGNFNSEIVLKAEKG